MATKLKTRKKEISRRSPRRKSQRRPQGNQAADPRVVLILGAGKTAGSVRNLVLRLGLECRVATEPRPALDHLDDDTGLVIVVPPLPDLSAAEICRRLRDRPAGSRLPVFVIGSPERQILRLYKAGASGQFAWPEERAALIRSVLRVVGAGPRQPSGNSRDAALSAKAEERILAEQQTFGSLLTVEVHRGVVVLGGEVDGLWKLAELERLLSAIPGVREVVTHFIRIPSSNISDKVISRSVRNVLRSAAGLDHQTFAVQTSNGIVVLTGTAKSGRELDRVIALIGQVQGVRGIENLATIAPLSKARESRLAGSLTRLAAKRFPDSRVQVEVFGKVAVLSGRARSFDERRAVERLAAEHPRIDRVISKFG